VTVDGTPTTKYIASDGCSSSGADYNCPMNNRGYIINTPNWDTSNPDFFTPNLLGGSVEWDMNVSGFECGCFNTFYTVSMPGKKSDGSLDWQDGYFYCDANAGNWGGAFCPEMDLMEANKYGLQTTPHKCNSPSGSGHYDYCDGSGSAKNVIDELGWNGYGPGGQNTIDTTQPFHVKVDLNASGNNFNQVVTTLTQNGKSAQMTNNDSGYMSAMSNDLSRGMVFVVSAWMGDDSWLRKDKCSGGCGVSPTETISNITIKTGSGSGPVDPTGPYDPADYTFGDPCGSPSDDICGQVGCPSVDHCKWSWPNGASWDSPDAHCRCDFIP